ncbi:MAG: SMC-Scp complex subunit ScpB [Gemmatimonadota bacterium]|nr:SMC-Scp complex subunit ScpB [Gemmatimonadota bacterium]
MGESYDIDSVASDEDARNQGIVEALLMASDRPLGASQIASLLDGVRAGDVRAYVEDLNTQYGRTGRSFKISEIAGGFLFMVHSEYGIWVRRLLKDKAPVRLSSAALETLAIVVFKQPVMKAEVEHIRGVSVDGVVRHLLEKGLIRIAGRSDAPGRPLLYGTTRDFLKHFGLKTLSDLPKVRELDELLDDKAAAVSSQGEPLQAMGRPEASAVNTGEGSGNASGTLTGADGRGGLSGAGGVDTDGGDPNP